MKKHLNQFHVKLEKRLDKGNTPYNLRNCAYQAVFGKDKIVWQEMAQEPCFMYDTNSYFVNDTCRIMTGKNIKFLLAYFNTKLFGYIFSKYYAGGGLGEKGIRFKGEFLKEYPVPEISLQAEIPYVNLVDEIICLKQQNHSTKPLEDKIDIMVYKLYELTYSEVKIIDLDFWLNEEEYNTINI